MRACAKTQCNEPAAATVVMRYRLREVALVDLLAEHDPNYLDLCRDHADRLVPPIGWSVRDSRVSGSEAVATATVGRSGAHEEELRLGAFEPAPPRWPQASEIAGAPRNGDRHGGPAGVGADERDEHPAGHDQGEDPGSSQPPLGGLG